MLINYNHTLNFNTHHCKDCIIYMYFDFADGYHGSIKAKRARASQVKHKSTISLYNKVSDMISNLAELIDIQELTDTTILQVGISSSTCRSHYFSVIQ